MSRTFLNRWSRAGREPMVLLAVCVWLTGQARAQEPVPPQVGQPSPAPPAGTSDATGPAVGPGPAADTSDATAQQFQPAPRPRPAATLPSDTGPEAPAPRPAASLPSDEASRPARPSGPRPGGSATSDATASGVAERLGPLGPSNASANLGFSYGLTDDSAGGFQLALAYGYRLTERMWFDGRLDLRFGSDCTDVKKGDEVVRTDCGSVHGFAGVLSAGVQWHFYGLWEVPVVPFVRADLGILFLVARGPYDGVAPVLQGAGGFRYHFADWFGVGGELGLTLGPVFRSGLDAGLYTSVEVSAGAYFAF